MHCRYFGWFAGWLGWLGCNGLVTSLTSWLVDWAWFCQMNEWRDAWMGSRYKCVVLVLLEFGIVGFCVRGWWI
ncbi:hypothetical protein DL95DRAFT_389026 [Leptodontidium sp. 2 PMI_412]|nr:hypothetical protein DL95DRAFT_389026 [Leptodontidium sp. 2 PMI_412]